jgi:hypothetical protein
MPELEMVPARLAAAALMEVRYENLGVVGVQGHHT